MHRAASVEIKHPFKKVLNGHIIIRIDEFRYTGNLIIPEVAKRKPTKGRVIAVADDITDIVVGDCVLYSQFAGYLLSFEGMPLMRTLGYSEVLAILEENAPEMSAEGA